MTHNAETAWIALVLLILWAIATAIGASVGAIVARNRGSALTMIVGGVLGSAGGSAAPIAMGFCDRGDMGFWAMMTALLAAVGGYIGSTVAAPVGCGIVAVSFIGSAVGVFERKCGRHLYRGIMDRDGTAPSDRNHLRARGNSHGNGGSHHLRPVVCLSVCVGEVDNPWSFTKFKWTVKRRVTYKVKCHATNEGLAAFLVLAWRAPEMMLQGHLSTEVIGVYSEPWSGILMLLTKQRTIVLAVAVFLLHPLRAGETSGPTHRVSFSGELAKLMRECGVEITSSLSQKKPAFAGKVSDFPVELRAAEFGAAMVDVTDSSGARVLAILLDRPLFRDDTDCNLCLDKPTCETSIRRSGTACGYTTGRGSPRRSAMPICRTGTATKRN